MSFQQLFAFFMALLTFFSGRVMSVVGSTDATPIVATQREYRFDQDSLLLGAYCFRVDEHFEETREWFKEAGLQFSVAVSGNQLTGDDLDWFLDNGLGIIAPRSDYYKNMRHDAIWGIDLRDEPPATDFPALQEQVQELYAQDPNRFPLINLFPMYANTEQLAEECDVPLARDEIRAEPFNGNSIRYRMHLSDYIGTVDSDIISADIYPLYIDNATGKLNTYGHWLRNLDILADACRASGRDLWVITQAAGNAKEEGGGMRHCDNAEDQRWQNYVSLAFGAKAIIYGCYYTGWWDQSSHMIDNSGKRTATYYAVQQVNSEMAAFAETYGNYEIQGTTLYNRLNPDCAGAELDISKAGKKYQPVTLTKDPVLCGCFTEKDGDGSAYVFANMYEPDTGKEAAFSATFPGAKSITVYRMGEKTVIDGSTLTLTLENREGVFVTVDGASGPIC